MKASGVIKENYRVKQTEAAMRTLLTFHSAEQSVLLCQKSMISKAELCWRFVGVNCREKKHKLWHNKAQLGSYMLLCTHK